MPFVQVSSEDQNCDQCSKSITKNEIMIGVARSGWGDTWGQWENYKAWSHLKCYAASKSVKKPMTTDGLYGYYWSSKKDKLKVMNELWPNQVSDSEKPKLILPKNINDMTCKELKLELQKRDLRYSGKKQDQRDTLKN